jgi:hypothetical protein
LSCTVNVGGLCAVVVVVSCVTLSSWAYALQLLMFKDFTIACTEVLRLEENSNALPSGIEFNSKIHQLKLIYISPMLN